MKKRKKVASEAPKDHFGVQRLNKILARAGLGSRREVEELITQERVEIDNEIVSDLASKFNPAEVSIKVDGQPVRLDKPVYYALNKPPGVLSTNHDPSGRIRVVDFVPDTARVFSVGRLDRSSEGLMLLTNDGELAQRLAHPRYNVRKTYFVVVAGVMTREELARLHKGVYLAEGFARIDGARIRRQRKGSTELEIVLSEGKNREIRRILAKAGHKVVLLRRIAIGSLRLGQLPVGGSRELTPGEVKSLYALTSSGAKSKRKRSKGKKNQSFRRPATDTTHEVSPAFISPESVADDEDWELSGIGDQSEFEDRDWNEEEFDSPPFSDFALGDAIEGEWDTDDDFVGGFGQHPAGSVLGGEDDLPDEPRRREARPDSRANSSAGSKGKSPTRKPRGQAAGQQKAAGKKASASGPGRRRSTGKRSSVAAVASSPRGRIGRGAKPHAARSSQRPAKRQPSRGRGKRK
jgi:23S rRNA pseudouridine2605 synthase